MSKNTKNEKSVPARKGVVVNRRHNRTVSQDKAVSDPKWDDIGHGILKRKGPGNKTAHISHKGSKFASLSTKEVDVALAPTATEVAQAAE